MSATAIPVRRKATLGICGKCHAPVLGGLDGDSCSFHAIVDISPLNRNGILLAIMENIRTYDLIAGDLHIREIAHYGKTTKHAVLREHRCGRAITAAERVPPVDVRPAAEKEIPAW